MTFYILSDDCAEDLSDGARDEPVITLQTSDMSEPTEDRNLTISKGSGETTTVTVRFTSGTPGTAIMTTVTAVRLEPVSGSAPTQIFVTDIILSDGTKAVDIGAVDSTTPTSGMFRLEQLRETPVDSFVITVDNGTVSGGAEVVLLRFGGCIKSG